MVNMKRIGFIVVGLFVFVFFEPVAAQNSDFVVCDEDTTIYAIEDVDEKPKFPGGEDTLQKFLMDNTSELYHRVLNAGADIEGRVWIECVVEKDGSLTDFSIARSVTPILDEEALRVVKLMPLWISGERQGKIVRVRHKIPITFTLYN